MTKAVRSLVFASLVSAAGASLVLACSDDEGSTFNTEGKDSGSDSQAVIFDPGSTPPVSGDSGPVQCNAALPTDFEPTWRAPAAAATCTAKDVEDWFEACNPNTSDDACKAWVAAKSSCAACIEPDDGSGPIRVGAGRKFHTLNLPACIAVVNGKAGADSCAAKYFISDDCAIRSCDTCFDKGGNFFSFDVCRNSAWSNACASYETGRSTACEGDDDVPAGCTGTEQENQDRGSSNLAIARAAEKAIYTRVISAVCVPN